MRVSGAEGVCCGFENLAMPLMSVAVSASNLADHLRAPVPREKMHVGGPCLRGLSARPVLHDRRETDLDPGPDTGTRMQWLQGTRSGAGGWRSGRGGSVWKTVFILRDTMGLIFMGPAGSCSLFT